MSSSWPSALASLNDALALPYESLRELEAVKPVDTAQVVQKLKVAAQAAQDLRASIASMLPDASWQTRDELDLLLVRIQKISEARSRLLDLATELERGSIVHRRALRVSQLSQLRARAIDELRLHAASKAEPPVLPGPEAAQWIEWACRLEEPGDAETLMALRNRFTSLDDFVADLESGMWIAKTDSELAAPNCVELKDLVQQVGGRVRSRLEALAFELERGRIVHHRALRVTQLNELREQAIIELRCQSKSSGEPLALPGPVADKWIDWACRLKEPEDAEALSALRSGFAHLDDFIASLEPDMWIGGQSTCEKDVLEAARSDDARSQEQFGLPTNNSHTSGLSPDFEPIASTAMGPAESERELQCPQSFIDGSQTANEPGAPSSDIDLTNQLRQQVETYVTPNDLPKVSAGQKLFSNIGNSIQEIPWGKIRIPLAISAVVIVTGSGIAMWRSHKNHSIPSTATVTKMSDRSTVNTENTAVSQSGVSTGLPMNPAAPISQTTKESKPQDSVVAPKTVSSTSPATQPKTDAGGVLQPVIAVPSEVANLKKSTSPVDGVTQTSDPPPPKLAIGVSNTLPGILTNIPVSKPKIALEPVGISSGSAQQLVIYQVTPKYPAAARQLHVQGTVVLQAVIGKDGNIVRLNALSGHSLLVPAALDAVKKWRFKPYYLNGSPVEADTQINVKFDMKDN